MTCYDLNFVDMHCYCKRMVQRDIINFETKKVDHTENVCEFDADHSHRMKNTSGALLWIHILKLDWFIDLRKLGLVIDHADGKT